MIAAEWHVGQVFFSMLWFFLFLIWIYLLIIVFTDIFRSSDLSGWGKALWTIFVVILPYFGVFIYLIVRGGKMHERAARDAQAQDAATREYIKGVAGSSTSTADEISRLADLKDKGVISDAEFEAGKAKALASG